MKNKLIESWDAGKPTVNGWLSIANVTTAEFMSHQGWDSLTIDLQHGFADYQVALQMLTAVKTSNAVPMARVPWLDEGIIMRMLDAGCYGIICPMVNTKEEAHRFVRACNYAPVGSRSFGPPRAMLHAGPDYWKTANDEILSIGMIETKQALDNLDAILDVEEMKGVYIGPADLSLSLGCTPKFDQEEETAVQAIEHVIKTAKAKGKRVGIHNGTVAYSRRTIEWGADFVTIASDMRLMIGAAQAVVKEFRETGNGGNSGGSY